MALELKKEGLAPVGGEIQMSRPEERVVIETPEAAEAEVAEMQQEVSEEPVAEPTPAPAAIPVASVERPTHVEKDRVLQEIEAVLSEDLDGTYKAMPPAKQKPFKERGEKLAALIWEILQ